MTNYIAEAIEEAWGERCPEVHPDCHCCRAWKQYDDLREALERTTGIAEVLGYAACFNEHSPISGSKALSEVKEARAILARQQQAAEEAA